VSTRIRGLLSIGLGGGAENKPNCAADEWLSELIGRGDDIADYSRFCAAQDCEVRHHPGYDSDKQANRRRSGD
jgi:hypothetical protein